MNNINFLGLGFLITFFSFIYVYSNYVNKKFKEKFSFFKFFNSKKELKKYLENYEIENGNYLFIAIDKKLITIPFETEDIIFNDNYIGILFIKKYFLLLTDNNMLTDEKLKKFINLNLELEILKLKEKNFFDKILKDTEYIKYIQFNNYFKMLFKNKKIFLCNEKTKICFELESDIYFKKIDLYYKNKDISLKKLNSIEEIKNIL